MSRSGQQGLRVRRTVGPGRWVALACALGVAAGAGAEERLYVQQSNPSRLTAWSFDGTSFQVEDPSPGTPETSEPIYAGPQMVGGSDRWFLAGYWGPMLALTVADPATGQELPVVGGDGGGANSFVVSPDGKKVWGVGPHLSTYDLDPASSTFLQLLPGRILLPTTESHEALVANPAGDRLYLASRVRGVPGSIVRVFDVTTPATPVLLGTYEVPPSAGGTGEWVAMKWVEIGGGAWLALARRDLVLVPLVGGVPDLDNRREWYGYHPISGSRRRVHAVWAQDTPSGPRAFAATNSFSGVAWQNELLVFDLAQPLLDGPAQVVPVTPVDATFDNEYLELAPSLSGDHLYLLQEGGEIAAHGYDRCKLRAYDLDTLAAGLPGAELAAVPLDPAANVCQAFSLSVRDAPPPPPVGPVVDDAVVAGALPPAERLIDNGAARTLTITGSGLGGVLHAYLGHATLTLGTVTATSVTATVPALTPAGDPKLVLVDGAGAMATFDGLRVVNPPQFLPGSKVYASSSPRAMMVEINAANANEVLSTFPTAAGAQAPAVTPDGRLALVPGFTDGAARVHSIVADPARGWDWNESIQDLYASYNPREIEISPDGRRAYVNGTLCSVSVIDLEAQPPILVDTDSDPGTTDFDFFDGVDSAQHALQQGVSRIPMQYPWGECLVTWTSALSPDGEWLYLNGYAEPGIVVVHLGAHADPDFVDPATDITLIDIAGVPGYWYPAQGLAVSPDGGTLYWTSNGETQVRVFAINPLDGADLTELAPIPLPGSGPEPWNLALSPDGETLYVTARSSGAVHIFDLSLDRSARAGAPAASVALPWGAEPAELAQLHEIDRRRGRLRPLGAPLPVEEAARLAAARRAEAPDAVNVISVPLGGSAGGAVPSPDGNWVYVSSPSRGMIAIIDRRPASATLNQVLTTTGAGIYLGSPTPSPGLATPPGDPEALSPAPGTAIDYSNVTSGGSTTVTSSNVSSVAVPADFQVELPGGAPVYYDVTTDAAFSGPVTVCFAYDDSGMSFGPPDPPPFESDVRLLHEEGGVFVDVTSSLDTGANVVCGVVTGFSQFAQAIFAGAIAVDPPAPATIAEPAGGSSFVVRGTVAPTGNVTVSLAVAGDCVLSGGVSEVVLNNANYLAGVVVGVDVVDDGDPEPQEVCTITTAPADADDGQLAYESYDASDVTLLVDDDDSTDLEIAKTDGVAAVAPGGQLTYTIALANRGSAPITGASFADPLPAGTSYASSGCAGGANCSIAGGATVTGTVDLAPGATATFTVTVDVDAGAAGDLVNTATIDGWGGLADLFPGNDLATDTTRVEDADPPGVTAIGSLADTGDGALVESEVTAVDIVQLLVGFDEPVRATDASSPASYRLYRSGPDQGFETVSCAGVAGSDEEVAIDAAAFASGVATLSYQGGAPLADGLYQLRVCAAIRDPEGNALDGDGNGAGGDDFLRTFRVDRLAPTVTGLSFDPLGQAPFDPGQPTNAHVNFLYVHFSEAMNGTTAGDAGNFHLLTEGGEAGFQTTDCASGVATGDVELAFDWISYDAGTHATGFKPHSVALGEILPHGFYRLLVCGSTSVEDLAGRKLDGDYDQVGGDDFVVDFLVDHVAPAPPSTLFSTTHGPFTWSQLATIGMRWSGAFDHGLEPTTGIQGYDFVFTATGEDTDFVIDLAHGADPHDALSAPLPDGIWSFRLRDFDGAGNSSIDLVAGPYFIDTTAPSPPASVTSPSHGDGPSNDPTIDVAWGPGADNLSGLDGYAWSFSASASWTCDEALDGQEWAASASSPPFGEGEWYFHLCARDNAGNWGAAASYGPWTIDTTAPQVASLDSVPEAGLDGVATPAVEVALTQLLVGFSEGMAESGTGAVTDPANWRLVEAGVDAVVDTVACGALGGDDVAAPIAAVQYDAGTDLAALAVGSGAGLPAGSYRLLACPSLTDAAGNALATAPWTTDFDVAVEPLAANPNFDADLSAWMVTGPVAAELGWLAEDAEAKPFSGAARLDTAAGAGAFWYLETCVVLPAEGEYELSSLARIASAEPGAPAARVFLTWVDTPTCFGTYSGLGESTVLTGDSAGVWQPLAIPPVASPPGSGSVWISFEVQGGASAAYTVDLDRVLFASAHGLFSDDFETGTPCRWALAVGGPGCP